MRNLKYFTPFLLLITLNSYGQFTVSGKVINQIDKKPIGSATAFFNHTGMAATATDSGTFTLRNVPQGHYQLLVAIVGYNNYSINVTVTQNTHLPDIHLTPKYDTLAGVNIKAKPKISPFYYLFRPDFLGTTLFARQCKILNPWVIDFYDTDLQNSYKAKSNGFVQIENYALGYKINFLLTYFIKDSKTDRTGYSGESYFEEMKGTRQQQLVWEKNRMKCYQGSSMQFLRSLLAGNSKQQGYIIKKAYLKKNPYYDPIEIYDDPMDDEYLYSIKDTILREQDIVLRTNQPGLFGISSGSANANSCLYVEYHEHQQNLSSTSRIPWIWSYDSSYVLFDKPYAVFDFNGIINTPENITFTGFLAEGRVANQLPVDFEPTQ